MRRLVIVMLIVGVAGLSDAFNSAKDPGVRGGPAAAGGPVAGLTPDELALFEVGRETFQEVEDVASGLGPRFNLDSCGGCHSHPAVGGSSPAVNPQIAVASKAGAVNGVPYFIQLYGPVREVRLKYKPQSPDERDGSVHNLYTITGRADAPGCSMAQPDFERETQRENIIFRIPTPLFGAGLIEAIPDRAILEGFESRRAAAAAVGIEGRPNRGGSAGSAGSPNVSANTGTITRFGWKAQNPSLLFFAGEAYNVEMGVTNPLFPTKRDATAACQFNSTPEDHPTLNATSVVEGLSDTEKFAAFMRLLAPPTPAPATPSSERGALRFQQVGCAFCHVRELRTGRSSTAALNQRPVRLFSDLLLHHMGPGLADDIHQGTAGSDEFRSAPLWGLGQRIFFLHDGRTTNLLDAIQAHASEGSEANESIRRFNRLRDMDRQDVLNFLRSL